ncbi:MAG: Glutamine--fructose-6-phosphate aminotransferase (isomerizing) [Syntrophaceae bacterium PtaU1.Bin231]|nr:MAG: Glutamine--fructose-6-phosphate aminotransferase (isomerizing) [Syntrophaceae bacterium PtaU1.Bin231]
MCGIFGIALREGAQCTLRATESMLNSLYRFSESRGKESAGLHVHALRPLAACTIKSANRGTELIRTPQFHDVLQGSVMPAFGSNGGGPLGPVALLGHTRLVTNGAAERYENNQPVSANGVTMIHNGIVVNVGDLWASHGELTRTAEVDTEILAALAGRRIEDGTHPVTAIRTVFGEMKGAASVALVHNRWHWLMLATNTGDLYRYADEERGFLLFASERFILSQVVAGLKRSFQADPSRIAWLRPGFGAIVDLRAFKVFDFPLTPEPGSSLPPLPEPLVEPIVHRHVAVEKPVAPFVHAARADETLLRYGEAQVRALRRCSRCILPETFPFIEYDEQGVCNYCRHYRPRLQQDRKKSFIEQLQQYRSKDGSPDALVAFSGGRDSSYGLHLIKNEFGLSPITFTYDWGMVTDLARRNVARICGKLGIQNILVSADIKQKRENIRKNVAAWLRKPSLGIVPLFMAGDKYFFRQSNIIKRQTGIRLDLWCANPLENTDFKAGFCGVPPDFGKARIDYLSNTRKVRLAAYYAKEFLGNLAYVNGSLADTALAFFSYYLEPRHDFFFIFDYIPWEEREVERVLLNEYDWELAVDTKSTWRIGDGTAPFYNYIYVTARGFSEFDTFRSNQIREGMMDREAALEAVLVENRPRYQSLVWYLDTIGLDFNETISRINELDIMGLHR